MALALSEISLPRGVSDFLPDTAARIGHIEAKIRRVFDLWGFRRIITPKLEYEDVLSIGLGECLKGKTYRFDDRQTGRLLAFPPDITPQVARIVATRLSALPLPHRISYSGRVLRQTEMQAGHSRELFQSGVELIGLDSPEADAEMVAMAVEALHSLGIENFKIDLGQVEFCRGVLDSSGLCGKHLPELRTALSRKDTSAVADILASENDSIGNATEIAALPRLFGGLEILDEASRLVRNPRSAAALANLRQVVEILEIHGLADYLTIDLGETRGLDYHTGVTFEGFVPGFGEPVCSGGRYDNLTSKYGFPAPATGFTFNVLSLLQTLEQGSGAKSPSPRDFLIFNNRTDKREALETARQLRMQGYTTARDIIRRDLDDSLNYARRTGFSYMLVIGDDNDGLDAIRVHDGVRLNLKKTDFTCSDLLIYLDGMK